MAMVQTGPKAAINEYIILSDEDMDTTNIPEGSTCLEIDTGDTYYFYKGQWYKVGEQL